MISMCKPDRFKCDIYATSTRLLKYFFDLYSMASPGIQANVLKKNVRVAE